MAKATTLDEARQRIQTLSSAIDIETCGTWLWLHADRDTTYPIKEELKEIGCWWSKDKQKWYWRDPESKRRYFGGRTSMPKIRARYASDMEVE